MQFSVGSDGELVVTRLVVEAGRWRFCVFGDKMTSWLAIGEVGISHITSPVAPVAPVG